MLVDYVSRKKRSRALQRCHSTRDLLVASVFLQKRCAHGADGPRRISADFGSPRTIFHRIIGHGSHALKNLDPGVGTRFRRMNRKTSKRRPEPRCGNRSMLAKRDCLRLRDIRIEADGGAQAHDGAAAGLSRRLGSGIKNPVIHRGQRHSYLRH